MDIRAAEISAILKNQIKNFGQDAEVSEVGQVLSVGDGIARVYGLDNVQAGEMVEFPGGIRGMALNLEPDNVGIVIFGTDRDIKEGRVCIRDRDSYRIVGGYRVFCSTCPALRFTRSRDGNLPVGVVDAHVHKLCGDAASN